MKSGESVLSSYKNAADSLASFISNEKTAVFTNNAVSCLALSFKNNKKVLIAGNGGSACDAMHFAQELTGNFRKNRKALPAISLTDAAHITCTANDFGYSAVFERAVEAYGQEGDVLILLSTSGNSENMLRAAAEGKKLGLKTIALIGKGGGKLKGMCDHEIIVPGDSSDRIQEIHMVILHVLIEGIEKSLFPELY